MQLEKGLRKTGSKRECAREIEWKTIQTNDYDDDVDAVSDSIRSNNLA